MRPTSSTAVAATLVAVALASFPAGAAASKDYSQNSATGDAAAPLPAGLGKDYSMNSATGDYAPPIHQARPATRAVEIHEAPGFAWEDATAGAGVALGLALLGVTTARRVRRRHVSPPTPAEPHT
jgi:hypothetical protein